ncbi:XPNPEP2 family protein [Megaselia abdita]
MSIFCRGLFILIKSQTIKAKGFHREVCSYRQGKLLQPVSEYKKRLGSIREQMRIRASLLGPEIDGYILPSFDENLNSEVADSDKRLQYISGFSGYEAFATITAGRSALWVDEKFLRQADGELDCEWEIYDINGPVRISDWFESTLFPDKRIGADARLVPHDLWTKWETELSERYQTLVRINNNLVDLIWGDERPPASTYTIKVHEMRLAGEKWEHKIGRLRHILKNDGCDAMVVTSLTEIAYLLNIRGKDIPYTPVVKGYLLVTIKEIIFYTSPEKVAMDGQLHLKSEPCYNDNCVQIKDTKYLWGDLFTYSQVWKKVLVPAPCTFDKGASEAVYSIFPQEKVYHHISPVIFMKAKKNAVEREGMRRAHIKDGAAICEAMFNFEQRFFQERWTEMSVKFEIERSRISQMDSKGLSFNTVAAFGSHSAYPYYTNSNVTDVEVSTDNMLIIESGGQYKEGTTVVSRTYHFGVPTAEQKRHYTKVLTSILQVSKLNFPDHLSTAGVDTLARSNVWNAKSDYPHSTGHSIGSFLSVQEPPIDISNGGGKFPFHEGYFISNEPGIYSTDLQFGVRLGNVLEVVETGDHHSPGVKFLAFNDITLVPYEPKLIDGSLLSMEEKQALNDYNAKIRAIVGEELKRQKNMNAFYWMMNKTRHIREYLPEDEYYSSRNAADCLLCKTPSSSHLTALLSSSMMMLLLFVVSTAMFPLLCTQIS